MAICFLRFSCLGNRWGPCVNSEAKETWTFSDLVRSKIYGLLFGNTVDAMLTVDV